MLSVMVMILLNVPSQLIKTEFLEFVGVILKPTLTEQLYS